MGYGEFTQIHPCKNITSMFNLYLKLLLCRPRSRTAVVLGSQNPADGRSWRRPAPRVLAACDYVNFAA